jgi:hypothetical protein
MRSVGSPALADAASAVCTSIAAAMHPDILIRFIRFSLLVALSRRIVSGEGSAWHNDLPATNWSGGLRPGTSKSFKKFLKDDICQWVMWHFVTPSGYAPPLSIGATVARRAGPG